MNRIAQTIAAAMMQADNYVGTDFAADRERAMHTRCALELAEALELSQEERLEFMEACGVETPYGGWDHDGADTETSARG